jgi:hypothetical protein
VRDPGVDWVMRRTAVRGARTKTSSRYTSAPGQRSHPGPMRSAGPIGRLAVTVSVPRICEIRVGLGVVVDIMLRCRGVSARAAYGRRAGGIPCSPLRVGLGVWRVIVRAAAAVYVGGCRRGRGLVQGSARTSGEADSPDSVRWNSRYSHTNDGTTSKAPISRLISIALRVASPAAASAIVTWPASM